jgi:putative phosphoesterase
MLLAAFSDVHGNLPALQAVLADIAKHGPDKIICLGDLVGYGAAPNEVIEIIRAAGIPTVLGNYDDGVGFDREECGCAYTKPEDIERGDRSLRWTQKTVTPANKAWLRERPKELRFEFGGRRVLAVHGSPRRLNEYLYQDRPEANMIRLFAEAEAEVVLCGHTHLPYQRRIGEIELINVGTAGRPKDGDPRVNYALLEFSESVTATFPKVEYNVEAAASAIEASDLPHEFAAMLRQGGS